MSIPEGGKASFSITMPKKLHEVKLKSPYWINIGDLENPDLPVDCQQTYGPNCKIRFDYEPFDFAPI